MANELGNEDTVAEVDTIVKVVQTDNGYILYVDINKRGITTKKSYVAISIYDIYHLIEKIYEPETT